jgi:hypothetical protein
MTTLKLSQTVFDSIADIRKGLALDAEEGHWITVNGAHIKISEGGKIVAGPSQLKQALEHHQKSSGHHAEQAQKKDISEKQQVEHENASRHHEKALSHLETAMTTPKSDPAHSRNVNLAELYSKHAAKAEQNAGSNASSEEKPKQKESLFSAGQKASAIRAINNGNSSPAEKAKKIEQIKGMSLSEVSTELKNLGLHTESKPKSGSEQLKEAEQKAAERAKNGPKSMKRQSVIKQEMKKYSQK